MSNIYPFTTKHFKLKFPKNLPLHHSNQKLFFRSSSQRTSCPWNVGSRNASSIHNLKQWRRGVHSGRVARVCSGLQNVRQEWWWHYEHQGVGRFFWIKKIWIKWRVFKNWFSGCCHAYFGTESDRRRAPKHCQWVWCRWQRQNWLW